MRIRLLNRKVVLKCNHGGVVEVAFFDRQVNDDGSTMVTDVDLLQRSKVHCPGPCKIITEIIEGRAADLFTNDGEIPMLQKLRATTDGPGIVKQDDADLRAAAMKAFIAILRVAEGGWHDTEYERDAKGQFVLDANGNKRVSDPETNKGITIDNFNTYAPTPPAATHARFMVMSDDDWNGIFKNQYWDPATKAGGQYVEDPAVAGMLVDWKFNGGLSTAQLQKTLRDDFGQAIGVDGINGSGTIDAINAVDPDELLEKLRSQREAYYRLLAKQKPGTYGPKLKGWLARLADVTAKLSKVVNGQVP